MSTLLQDDITTSDSVPARLLIADDQPAVLEALRLLLKTEGYQIEWASSPAGIMQALESGQFDLLLMDLNYARDTTSGQEGLDLLARIRAVDSSLPIVVMTAWGSVELAVEAMRRGVGDFVLKPWVNARLLATLRQQLAESAARREAERLEAEKNASRHRRQEEEFAEARAIQQGFLPKQIPQFRGFSLSGACQPARGVGGDYFDVLSFGDRRFALCIADVVGKGVPAALLMSNLQATVRGFAAAAVPPEELCARVNRFIYANMPADRFITFFYCLIDDEQNRLVYTNAGHNAPVLLRRDGSVERLQDGGPVLGMFVDTAYSQQEVSLGPEDCLVLFTDGVVEARNAEGEEFGEPRLIELLRAKPELGAAELEQVVLTAVTNFSGAHPEDDVTLIVLKVARSDMTEAETIGR